MHWVAQLAHTHSQLELHMADWACWAGQLAGIKLDPWVPRCSLGLKAILKTSPIVLQHWGNMNRGQENQLDASHTPGGLHLLCLYIPRPTSAWHIVSCAHMPVLPAYMHFITEPHFSTEVLNFKECKSDHRNESSVTLWLWIQYFQILYMQVIH